MKPVEVVFVNSNKVSCQGTKGSSTHPLVYLNISNKAGISCPYCSKHFVIKNTQEK